MMKLPRIIFDGLLLLAGLLAPSLAWTDDLLSLYRSALSQDPIYLAARYALQASEQKVPQARADLLPVISLGADTSSQHGSAAFNEAPEEDRHVRSNNWSLRLAQPLFRPASWSMLSQAEAQYRQAVAQFRLASQDVILRVAQAFFDALLAQESFSVASAQLNAVTQQLSLAKRNFQVGTATITDVHEAQSRLDLARSQQIAASNELTVKRAELERVAGTPPSMLPMLSSDASLPRPYPDDVDKWIALAQTNSPLIAIQDGNKDICEHQLARSRAGHAPTVDIHASYGSLYSSGSMTSPTDVPTRSRAGQIGLQVAVPIWSGGAVASRIAEAQANLDKALADREASRRQAVTQSRQAFSGIASGHAQVEALASAVLSSQEAVKANQIGYRIGTRINIDVLNAEQQLYSARRDLARAKMETLMHGLRLKAATGSLTEQDVIGVNALLDSIDRRKKEDQS
ncbi:TolC family outer membrane protein [Zoogloea sp.]|uniref:TolC family outer membrane protein n=1 Tax=Zoogloea sp. TaxID=49181 RepID=UPI0035AFB8F7